MPKKPAASTVADHRPIAKLSIISKIFERHINQLIWKFLTPVISNIQYGFRSGRSTVDCLANVVHSCSAMLDDHKKAVGVFFDLRAAFDSVDHQLLIAKLQHQYLIPSAILRWLTSYLSDRKYCVSVNGVLSSERAVSSGVPQGSVIGPTLFLAFIDGLTGLILSPSTQCFLYADDLLLLKPITCAKDEADLQADICSISNYIKSISLEVNVTKTKYLVLAPCCQAHDCYRPVLR